MEIILRNSDKSPIYEQICRQIRAQILSGALLPGTLLPSIRGLAKDLKISVITTKRAYDELELEGYVNTIPGKGCFVAQESQALTRERQLKEMEAHLIKALELGQNCGLQQEEILTCLRTLFKEQESV